MRGALPLAGLLADVSLGGSAHTTAYDFFAQHPEGAFQLMTVLSDLGIPRDIRHISGNGVHTFRFINANGDTKLFKWYWKPTLGHRAVVYDEALKIAGKNQNFQRVDLYNNIAAGVYPEWEFMVQLFPDDGNYTWKGIDLLDATQIVPFEMNPPMSLGKLTLNKNPTNYFAEPESISFAPSNAVKGISFVPDPLLQWRLMSYDDTTTHRHNSPNGYLLPVNRAIAPINNNYRDGYMQPFLYEGVSQSSPDGLDGVIPAPVNQSLPYTGNPPELSNGTIGRFEFPSESFSQARTFYYTLDKYAQQHLVDGYRFELGHVAVPAVQQRYIDDVLNKIDNCLARRVAEGIGASLPAIGSGAGNTTSNSTVTRIPSLYPLAGAFEPNKSNAGLTVGILADDNHLSTAQLGMVAAMLQSEQVSYEVVSSHIGKLQTGVFSNQSYVTTSSVFYDTVIIGSSTQSNKSGNNDCAWVTQFNTQQFIQEAYGHGKALAVMGGECMSAYSGMGISPDGSLGVYTQGNLETMVMNVMQALAGPVRFPQRFPVDDMSICQ